jgi:hypothetical protein
MVLDPRQIPRIHEIGLVQHHKVGCTQLILEHLGQRVVMLTPTIRRALARNPRVTGSSAASVENNFSGPNAGIIRACA